MVGHYTSFVADWKKMRFLSLLLMSLIQKNGKTIGRLERRGLKMLDTCYFCKGKVIQQQVTIDYRWGGDLVVIKDVPAGVCQQCGEKYFQSAVYKAMEKLAASRAKPAARLTVDVMRFKKVV